MEDLFSSSSHLHLMSLISLDYFSHPQTYPDPLTYLFYFPSLSPSSYVNDYCGKLSPVNATDQLRLSPSSINDPNKNWDLIDQMLWQQPYDHGTIFWRTFQLLSYILSLSQLLFISIYEIQKSDLWDSVIIWLKWLTDWCICTPDELKKWSIRKWKPSLWLYHFFIRRV